MDVRPSSSRADLLNLFRDGHALTYREITEHLSITSMRQARRLVRQLQEAGVPLTETRRGRQKEYALPPSEWTTSAVSLDLTEREALALVLATETVRSGDGTPLGPSLRDVFDRLVDALATAVETFEPQSLLDHVHVGDAASVQVDPDVFAALVQALENRRTVCIDYHTARSDTYHEGRAIQPWGLAERGDAWLCVARDPAKDAMRDFNLSRIDAVRPADPDSHGGDYAIPDSFDLELYFIDRFEALDDEAIYRVRLLVEADRVPYFRSKQYHRTQQIHDPSGRDDDRVVVSYEVAGLEEIASFVRSWGPGVTVLDPPALVERIAADAQAVVARYEATSPDL
jgi:predicted DNA-binding transcriptional regulator YafY